MMPDVQQRFVAMQQDCRVTAICASAVGDRRDVETILWMRSELKTSEVDQRNWILIAKNPNRHKKESGDPT